MLSLDREVIASLCRRFAVRRLARLDLVSFIVDDDPDRWGNLWDLLDNAKVM